MVCPSAATNLKASKQDYALLSDMNEALEGKFKSMKQDAVMVKELSSQVSEKCSERDAMVS